MKATALYFHANFLCVETFHSETGCSGTLFNDPYGLPLVTLDHRTKQDVMELFTRMRREQGELADLLKKLTRPKRQAAPEDDPEKLPDVRKSGPRDRRINGEADKADRQESPCKPSI